MAEIYEFFETILKSIYSLITGIDTYVNTGFEFLLSIIFTIPKLIVNSIFNNLPFVFREGLIGLTSCLVIFFIIKLISLIRTS